MAQNIIGLFIMLWKAVPSLVQLQLRIWYSYNV